MEKYTHGGNIYQEVSPQGKWLDFSANINALGLSASVRECLVQSIDEVVSYPDPEARQLKSAIARHYDVPRENIIAGNGAAELFYLFFQTMGFRRVLIPVPSFSEYERAALSAASEIEYIMLEPRERFALNGERLCRAMAQADCVVLGNPNNPTGNLLTAADLERCLIQAKKTWMMVDESFLDFREDRERFSVRHLVGKYPRLIVVQSLTKFYALPGLRLGFALAPSDIVWRMEQKRDAWAVNLLAQKAGTMALADEVYQRESRTWLQREKALLEKGLRQLKGLTVFSPSVNFILVSLAKSGLRNDDVISAMKRENILLRDCRNYPGLDDTYLRMAVRSHEENTYLLKAWKKLWQEKVGYA